MRLLRIVLNWALVLLSPVYIIPLLTYALLRDPELRRIRRGEVSWLFVWLLLAFILPAHAMTHKRLPDVPAPQTIGAVTPSPRPLPASATAGNLNLTCDDTCSDAQEAELPKIAAKVVEVETSPCFRNFKADRLDLSNGLTWTQVVEKLTGSKIGTQVSVFYKNHTREVGFESLDGKVHVNAKFWDQYSLCDKASLVGHELAHRAGFVHVGNFASKNYYTVPYTVNHGFDSCCK